MNQPLAVDVQTDGTDTAAGTDASSTTAPDAEASSASESQSEESTQGADAAEQETTGPEQKRGPGDIMPLSVSVMRQAMPD